MYIDVNIGDLCFTATINMKRPNYTRSIAMQMSQCHKGWLFVDKIIRATVTSVSPLN